MTQEQIIDFNKKCAEFLNLYRNEDVAIYKLMAYTYDSLKFHSDWNWIMEVVDAIQKLADWTLECLNYPDGNRDYQMMIPLSGTNIINNDKKEAVVQGINQFLIWYTQNKTT